MKGEQVSINTQKIILLFVLLASLILIASCGNQNGTAPTPKLDKIQIRLDTGQRTDEPPADGGTGTPPAEPMPIPPR